VFSRVLHAKINSYFGRLNLLLMKSGFFYLIVTCLFLFACQPTTEPPTEPMGVEISLPEGFEATLLYSPSAHDQGSWVSLTNDNQGRLIASDQYGSLYRITPPSKNEEIKVETIPIKLGSAQGLLWAFDALYVSVNAREDSVTKGSGLYKVTDTDGNDELDTVEKLFDMEGSGEHGPHGLMLGPEGSDLYLIAGNHTDVPEDFGAILSSWEEDRLFSPVLDPGGHANDRTAPGGWIARSRDQGKTWEVIANGFRNAYDIAFDQYGELFTFDSDMEWDLGSPWYRPIRVCHVIPGAEFGWRTGSGKWPAYYPDNLPGVVNIGQGSPTGVTFGTGAKFPAAYQQSLFILDWSFGTMYQVSLKPNGASYSGEKAEFLSGVPLPLTDVVIGSDGDMYFTTGGRRVASQLYRVRYVGNESTQPASSVEHPEPNLNKRRAIEAGSFSVKALWDNLSDDDRFIRYAARVALENIDREKWQVYLEDPADAVTLTQASLIVARKGYHDLRPQIIKKLSGIQVSSLSIEQQLELVRAYALLFIRTGPAKKSEKLNLPDFPSGNPALDRELCELMVFLGRNDIIGVALDLMEEAENTIEADLTPVEILTRSEQYGPTIEAMHQNRPTEQGLAFALALSNMENGWTPELRNRYFTWFYRAFQKSGGASYKGFLERIRQRALNKVPENDKKQLAELSGEALLQAPLIDPNIPQPEGPGRNWLMSEANHVVRNGLKNRSLLKGEQHFQALTCSACHVMNGSGGNVGPDLTQAGTRFSSRDMLYAMLYPSSDITDQYGATLYTLKDGSTIIGRTLRTTDETIFVATNPYNLAQETEILAGDVASSEPSPVSLMPAGLINRLNEEELLDLMAYLTSGGNPEHEVYGNGGAGTGE
jgi:putative heme-binding domain-containing protein